MKKIVVSLVIMLLAAMIAVLVFACAPAAKEETNQVSKEDQNAVAFQVVSASNLLAQTSAGATVSATPKLATIGAEIGGTLSKELDLGLEEKIAKYLKTAEIFVNATSLKINQEASDKEGYETKMSITTTDIVGEQTTYVFYFNKKQKAEIDANADAEFADPEDVEDISENEASEEPESDDLEAETVEMYEGLLVLGEGENAKEYKVFIRKTVSVEENETETELDILAKLDNKNYIKIEQNIESEDDGTSQEFKFTLVEEGKVVNRYAAQYEKEGKNTVFKLRIGKGKSRKQFSFKKVFDDEEPNKQMLHVDYSDDSITFKFKIKIVDGEDGKKEYKFVYESGKERTSPKWRNFDEVEEFGSFWLNFNIEL